MQAKETRIQEIIEGTKQFVVPLFQRPYSWDKKEWNTLWDDLDELCSEENPRSHFMGSVVTVPSNSVPAGVSKFLLIDGQQRVTTLYLLLAAIRNRAREFEGTLAAEIDELLLTNKYQKGNDYFKLLPTQVDRDSFIQVIKDEGTIIDSRILQACQFFEKKLKNLSSEQVEKLKRIIVDNLVLVSIVLDKGDNPHLVFESLNYKGKPLQQSDLIRNYFFMRIHTNEQERLYNLHWKPMETRLENYLTEFIRHYLMKDGAQVKEGEVYFHLKERLDQKNPEEMLRQLAELDRYSTYYAKLIHPKSEENSKISVALQELNRLDVMTTYPFLLNVYNDFMNGKVTEDEFISVFNLLENYMVRRFVCGVPSAGLNKIFPSLYKEATVASSLVDGIKVNLRKRQYPKDAEFVERFQSTKAYASGDRLSKTKLILERLEQSFAHKETIDFGTITIEHVMPQTLNAWWEQHLGENCEVTHEILLHTFGNLTLTGYNSNLSNKDYPSKKELLKESHIQLNRHFGEVQNWREEEIKERGKLLAKIACTLWPNFGLTEETFATSSDVTGKSPIAVIICGARISVKTWRDVAEKTIAKIIEMDDGNLEILLSSFPSFISNDKSSLRSNRQIADSVFMETHLSASSIYRACQQVTEMVGLVGDDWRVEIAEV